MARGVRKDRFTVWPIALACVFPAILVLLWSGPFGLSFAGVPILLFVWAISALAVLVITIVSVWTRDWRRALSRSILPLATLIMIAHADAVWSFAIDTGEKLHFRMERRNYLEDVSKLPTDKARLQFWNWGGFTISHGVIYDESDEVLLPEQSAAWKSRIEGTELVCGVWGEPLDDHFYLVRVGC
jgi:hypothetical protein